MGWLANMVFGKPSNVQSPQPPEHDVWGVNDEEVPNLTEQKTPALQSDATPPEVQVIRVEPKASSDGAHLELWICLENTSDAKVEVTRIECLKQNSALARFLKPGENHEVRVYAGPMPKNDADNMTAITYKSIQSGQYYRAEYLVKFKYSQHSGVEQYIPYEFDLQRPVGNL